MIEKSYFYLPGIIPVMAVEFVIALLIFRYYRNCCCCSVPNDDSEESVSLSVCGRLPFHHTFLGFNKLGDYVLLVTRLLSLGYICGVSVIYYYLSYNHHGWYLFSVWNAELVAFYFFAAVICSLIGFYNKPTTVNDVEWSRNITLFGRYVQILFEVAGGTSFFITAVVFYTIDDSFSFWNASLNVAPSIAMVVELLFSSIQVRYDHFPFNLAWVLLYFIFIWPLTVTKVSPDENWPYKVLDTKTPWCFLWYTVIYLINLVAYTIWYALSLLKRSMARRCGIGAGGSHGRKKGGGRNSRTNLMMQRAGSLRRMTYLPTEESEIHILSTLQSSRPVTL
jgi:hypothetical protein